MKKISIYVLSALMVVMAAIAVIKGLNKECILLCGLSVSANCLQDISDSGMKSGMIWYLLIICAVGAGFLVHPLIPIVVPCFLLVSLNLYSRIAKKGDVLKCRSTNQN